MTVAEVVRDLLELNQKAEIHFVKNEEDQLIYVVSCLPHNETKVCLQLPTAVNRKDFKGEQGE